MSKQILWALFILCLGVLTLWHVGKGGYAILSYFRLSEKMPITIETWEIREPKAGNYSIYGVFSYEFQKKVYTSARTVGHSYPNSWAAEKKAKQFASMEWTLWLDPHRPENVSLEKHFPVKSSLSALVLLAISLYFCFLGFFLRQGWDGRKQ